jgi:hypothetical protein
MTSKSAVKSSFNAVKPDVNFPALEEKQLRAWDEGEIFEKSMSDRANAKARLDDMPALLQAMGGWCASAGRIDSAGGDAAAAERDWLRALDFAPAQRESLSGLVDLYRRQGREGAAQRLVERSGAARPAPQRKP